MECALYEIKLSVLVLDFISVELFFINLLFIFTNLYIYIYIMKVFYLL